MLALSRLFALGALVSASAAPAVAATGVEWQWPDDEVRRYRIAADVKLTQPLLFSAEYNKDVRVFDFAVAIDTKCQPTRAMSKGWEIACDVTEAQFNAHAAANDVPIGMEVLAEWDQKLVDNATVTFVLTTDGRVQDFDVDGLNERNTRIRMIKETMRLVLLRGFAAFDLNLPKNGDGAKPWKQKTQVMLQLPVIDGMAGATQLQSEVAEEEGSKLTIDTVGRGTLTMQEVLDRKTPDSYDAVVRSRSLFDTSTGNLLERSYLVESNLTPGSGSAVGAQQVPYIQAVQLTYVADGMPMDMLGANSVETMQ